MTLSLKRTWGSGRQVLPDKNSSSADLSLRHDVELYKLQPSRRRLLQLLSFFIRLVSKPSEHGEALENYYGNSAKTLIFEQIASLHYLPMFTATSTTLTDQFH